MRRILVSSAVVLTGALLLAAPATAAWAVAPAPRPVAHVTGITGTPSAIALTPDGSTAYVIDQSTTVAIVDTATGAVTGHSIDFASGGYGAPTSVAVATDGSAVYVGTAHWMITLNPDGTLADQFGLGPTNSTRELADVPGNSFVVGTSGNTSPARLFRYNLGFSYSIITFAPAADPDELAGVAVATDGRVFTSGTVGGAGTLYVFTDATSLSGPAQQIALPGASSAGAVALNAAGTRAVVTSPADNRAYLVDTAAGSVLATIATPAPAASAAFSPDGATVYLALPSQLAVVDTSDGSISALVTTGGSQASGVVVSPSGARIWVSDAASGAGAVRLLSNSRLTAPAASGTVGTALSSTLTASGFDLPTSFTIAPALPAGLSLNAATGVISGTPSAASAATTYTVTASSADGDTATASWTLQVAAGTAPAALAATGPEASAPLLAVALLAIASGFAVLTTARRRARMRG
ncbi:MAG: hypothetical protein DI534_08520 [Leifsonia xyli]|nr:MAG: hypothetical protein DI534_08520 [Leifsonia xyli]